MAEKSLKDQFKATNLNVLKNKIKQEDSMLNTGGGRAGYLDILDGANKFRIYPKHKNEETYYHPKVVHWLTIDDDGELRRKPVYNSKTHGNTKLDVIEEYIRLAKAKLEGDDDEDSAKKLKAIFSWDSGTSLTASATWMMYADRLTTVVKGDKKTVSKQFGLLEVKKSVRDGMNKVSTTEDPDEPIEVDPFTDVDTGTPIILTYNSKAKKAMDYYNVALAKNPFPLTEQDLQAFVKVKPLSEIYSNCYTKSDFDLACEGLQYFDEENEIGLWDSEEWTEKLEEVSAQYASEGKSKKAVASSKPSSKKAKDVEEEEEEEVAEEEEEVEEVEEEGDELDDMDRTALKVYIKKNTLSVVVKTSMSDDDIREAIRAEVTTEEEEETEEEVEEEAEEEVEEEQPAKKKTKVPSLDDIKAKLAKKK